MVTTTSVYKGDTNGTERITCWLTDWRYELPEALVVLLEAPRQILRPERRPLTAAREPLDRCRPIILVRKNDRITTSGESTRSVETHVYIAKSMEFTNTNCHSISLRRQQTYRHNVVEDISPFRIVRTPWQIPEQHLYAQTCAKMPILSQWSLPIPLVSIPSHIFGSADGHVPDTPFMFDCEHPATRKFSLRDYRDWSKRLAAGLVEGGLQAGDRVMLFSGNSIFTPVVIMGTIMAGGIATTANPAFFPRELAHQLRDSGAKFILVDFDLLDCAQKAASMVNLSEDQIFCFDDTPLTGMSPRPSSIQHWSRLIKDPAAGARFQWEEFSTEAQTHRTAILFYSSGTTGLPKGVEATHRNIVANNCQLIHLQSLDPRFQKMDERGQARSLCALPMYHGLGLVIYTMIAPKRRMSVYLMKKFDGRKMLEYIQRFKITELVFVPPILGWMAKNPLSRSGTVDLSSVQRVLCGAAPLSASVSADFESLWENRQVNVKQAWGMSE